MTANSDPQDSRRAVEAGYDEVGDIYVEWSAAIEGDPRARFVELLTERLPHGSCVLDLGCGNG